MCLDALVLEDKLKKKTIDFSQYTLGAPPEAKTVTPTYVINPVVPTYMPPVYQEHVAVPQPVIAPPQPVYQPPVVAPTPAIEPIITKEPVIETSVNNTVVSNNAIQNTVANTTPPVAPKRNKKKYNLDPNLDLRYCLEIDNITKFDKCVNR